MPTPSTLLLLTLAQAVSASLPPLPADPASTLSPYELEVLSRTIDTANQQQRVDALLDHHIQYVRTRYQDRLTFLRIERVADVHIRVGLKGGVPEPDLHLPIAGTTLRVRVEVGYPYTEAEFSALVDKARPRINALIPDASGFSRRADRLIEIDVEGTNGQTYQHALAQIESLTGLKAAVRLGVGRPRDLI